MLNWNTVQWDPSLDLRNHTLRIDDPCRSELRLMISRLLPLRIGSMRASEEQKLVAQLTIGCREPLSTHSSSIMACSTDYPILLALLCLSLTLYQVLSKMPDSRLSKTYHS